MLQEQEKKQALLAVQQAIKTGCVDVNDLWEFLATCRKRRAAGKPPMWQEKAARRAKQQRRRDQ